MAAFHKIEEALEDLKKGKIILVTDDAERENEGDFISRSSSTGNPHGADRPHSA